MMTRRLVAAAIAGAALASSSWQAFAGAAEPKAPATATPVDYAKLQAAALAEKQLDVSYRHAFVAEVVQDLERRAGVRVAYPKSLGEGWNFTLEAKGLTAKDILAKLATEGKFDLEFRPDLAVLTQKADDKALADLAKRLASADRWERCDAAWGLGNLADPRIYPLLAKALADKDAGVVEWALKALEKHGPMGCVMGDAEKGAVVAAVLKWFKEVQEKDDKLVWPLFGVDWTGRYWPREGQTTQGRFQNGLLDLLGSTGRDDGIKALIEALHGAKVPAVRGSAATALGLNRLGAADLLAAWQELEAEMARSQAAINKMIEGRDRKKDKADPRTGGRSFTFTYPPEAARLSNKSFAWYEAKEAIVAALLRMRNPEAVALVQGWVVKGIPGHTSYSGEFLPGLVVEYGPILDLWEWVDRHAQGLKAFCTGNTVKLPDPWPAIYAVDDLRCLSHIQDAVGTSAMLALIKDDKAFHAMAAGACDREGTFLLADDPDLVAALAARVRDGGTARKLAVRFLANSHDPRAADALIEALKDPDPRQLAPVAHALAQTRDPRALAVLAALVRENRAWPDFEAEDWADLVAAKHRIRPNPRRLVILTLEETRDPKAFTELTALAEGKGADAQVARLARLCLRSAATTPADVDRLVEFTRKADVKTQVEILTLRTKGTFFPPTNLPPRELSAACASDGRWVELLVNRVWDEEAWSVNFAGKRTQNIVFDALAAIKTPTAEKAVARLCHDPDKGLAEMARKALDGYGDPEAMKADFGSF